MEHRELIVVDLVALVEDQGGTGPVVMLFDPVDNKLLPIWIGEPEARAIGMALNKIKTPRPLTHALLLRVTASLGGKLSRMVIDEVKNHTYYASLYIQTAHTILKIDARPSDALALALEAGIPILVARHIMEEAGQPNPFPQFIPEPRVTKQRSLSTDDVKKMKELLEKARARERQASGE